MKYVPCDIYTKLTAEQKEDIDVFITRSQFAKNEGCDYLISCIIDVIFRTYIEDHPNFARYITLVKENRAISPKEARAFAYGNQIRQNYIDSIFEYAAPYRVPGSFDISQDSMSTSHIIGTTVKI